MLQSYRVGLDTETQLQLKKKKQMDDYCCELQCIAAPRALVDGRACNQCQAYGYCRCACARDAVRTYTIRKLFDRVQTYRFTYSYVRYGVNWIDYFVSREPDLDAVDLRTDDWTYDGVSTLQSTYSGPSLSDAERRVVELFRLAKCFRERNHPQQDSVVVDSAGPSCRRISLNLLPRLGGDCGGRRDAQENDGRKEG